MPAKVSLPETKEFRLDRLDDRQGIPESEKTIVTIRLATIRQNAQRGRMFSEFVRELPNPGSGRGERVIFQLPMYDLICEEVWLTMVGCNLMSGEKPLFKFRNGPQGQYLDMTREQFDEAWGILDDDTAAEIHSKVLEMNPHWIIGATVEDVSLGEES